MSFQLSPELDGNKVFLVNSSLLEKRLDAEYYQPYHYKDLQHLEQSPYNLKKLDHVCSRIVDGPFGSAIKASDYVDNGVPFIRVADVTRGEGTIRTDDMIFISKEAHQKISRSKVSPNDVVIAKTGATMGAASLVPQEIPDANIRGDLGALTVITEQCLPKYLITYINTPIGQRLFWRLDSGGTRGRVVIGNLKKYPFLVPPKETQAQIVAKMDAAYSDKKQKEAEAQQLLDSIDDYLLGELGIELPEQEENTVANRTFFRTIRDMSGYRLDPYTYKKERLDAIYSIENGIYNANPLFQVLNHRTDKASVIEKGTTYIGLENIESNTGEFVTTEEKESISSASVFGRGDILFPKLRPYLNKVFYSDIEGLCSTEFYVLHSVAENNEYIANFLRSKVVVAQTKNLMSGNTLPRLQYEDIQKLLIPIPPTDKQEKIVNHITNIRNQAKELQHQAKTGLEQEKKEVEAIILGIKKRL